MNQTAEPCFSYFDELPGTPRTFYWSEPGDAERKERNKAADRYIAQEGLVIPLLRCAQPVVHSTDIRVTPHTAGFILPQNINPT